MSGNLKGALWALVSTGLFALAAALAKVAVADYHVLQILFFRQLVVLASALPALTRDFSASLATRHPALHGWRLAGAFVALSCGIWAVEALPLATAITLSFAQVFLVSLIAHFALGERLAPARVAAIFIGFLGVVAVMNPRPGAFLDPHALIPLAGAFGAAVAVASVRKLSQTETTVTLLAYQSIFVGLLAGIPMFWLWKTPDVTGLALLLSMGVIATVGQWVGVRALRLGEASLVGSIEYVKLVHAALLGLVLFGELPTRATLSGAAIILLAAAMLMRAEARRKRLSAI